MRVRRTLPVGRGFAALLVLLCLAVLLSLALGSSGLSLSELAEGLRDPDALAYRIVMYARLPRVLGGIAAGASLAVSGALLQAVLNNSLAGPNIIGVNAGAGFAALLVMALAPYSASLMPAAAFAGALCAALFIYAVARLSGASRTTIVLAGVAISSVVNAASSVIKTLFPDIALSYTTFSIGSLSALSMEQVRWASVYAAAGIVCAMLLSADVNILALGDDTARSLGLSVQRCRFALLCTAAVLAGAAVSFGGLIGFVGLLVPHIARILFGSDNRVVIPASALLGAVFLLLCDLIGRMIFAPFEIHVGIVLSIVGGAYFVALIIRRKGGRLDG